MFLQSFYFDYTTFERRKKMRPRRYPYSGKKESTFVKADPKLVESFSRNTSFLEHLQVVLATKL